VNYYLLRLDQRGDISEIFLFSKLDKDSRRLFDKFGPEIRYIRDILVLQARHRTPGDYLISLDQRVDISEIFFFSKLDIGLLEII